MPASARFSVLLLLAIAALAAACDGDGGPSAPTASPQATATPSPAPTVSASPTEAAVFPLIITDDSGRELTFEAPPQRIASLSAAHTEIFFTIGAGEQVVAVDLFSDFPAEAQERIQLDALTPNLEAIAGVDPDLVLIFFDPGDLITSLEQLNISVIFLETPAAVEGIFEQIRLLGSITGHQDEAEQLIADMEERIAAIQERLAGVDQGPRIFHELDPMLFTAGPGSFIDDVYRILKAQNIAADTGQAFPQLSNEAVIDADPEVIILADEDAGQTADTVAARPGWQNISAVVNDRVHIVDPDIVSRPGPRVVEALETLAALLYPELFP